MRETRLSGSEGGGTETNRSFLPLSAPFGLEWRRGVSSEDGEWWRGTELEQGARMDWILVASRLGPVGPGHPTRVD